MAILIESWKTLSVRCDLSRERLTPIPRSVLEFQDESLVEQYNYEDAKKGPAYRCFHVQYYDSQLY